MRKSAWAVLGLMVALAATATVRGDDTSYEGPPIDYLSAPVNDRVARLQRRLEKGQVQLEYEPERGYLKSLLRYLEIPESSQTLVFSKTSFQRTRIAPDRPRALYFNDDVYIGYVQGGEVLEISSVDPRQGAVFHTLDQTKGEPPAFRRMTHECLLCHANGKTQDVPGHLVRSVHVDKTGDPVFNLGGYTTTQSSPLEHRWGGWYVTGTHGDQTHMGNVITAKNRSPYGEPEAAPRLDPKRGLNVRDLKPFVDVAPYLTPHSDIVALMVLEHQTQMHNFLTAANYEARKALHYQEGINASFKEPPGTMYDGTKRRIDSAAEKLVKHMLFVEETKLTAPVKGTSSFATEFAARGPRDSKGRSLRDFDLQTRLFRFPCSYLIDSEPFEALPPLMKERVYARLLDVLMGKDRSADYAHLSDDDRQAILEILRETKADLPSTWSATAGG